MYRNLIVLPDGTEIFSGSGANHTIQSCVITSSSNSGAELTAGSVCSDALEVKFFTPKGNLVINPETEITLYKVDDEGNRTQYGLFTLQKPERPTRNTYKIMAFDRVSWLEKDMTDWLKSLNAWPYTLLTFAQMICDECLLELENEEIPNGDFLVNKFGASKITARDLMGYVGQLAARFCKATPDGKIKFSWYEDSGIELQPTGERYYNSLKYEDYRVEKIDVVQVQLADSQYGTLWPEKEEGSNAYILSGNPLITVINENLIKYLDRIKTELENTVYTPCKISLPACLDIRPGNIIRVVDFNDNIFETIVMTKTQSGRKDIIESTGSARRDSPAVVGAKTTQDYVDAAMKRQTQTEIFNKLTNYGSVQGIFLEENGQIYINAEYLTTGILQSRDGETFYLDLDNGILKINATELSISGNSIGDAVLNSISKEDLIYVLTENNAANGIYLKDDKIYVNAEYIVSGTLNASLLKAGILQSNDNGETFKLDLEKGTFHMSGTGKFMAPDKRSYMTMDGGSFVLYTKDTDNEWMAIAKIGFSEDSEGVDYPYMLLGHAVDTAEEKNLSLIKAFSNGIYIGNAVPKLSTGNFVGINGAVGFFVDIANRQTYNVVGTEMYDAFVAVFA